jgi:hypothetical protein
MDLDENSRSMGPLELALHEAAIFAKLATSHEGTRLRLYNLIAQAYRIGCDFSESPTEYRRFQELEFWRDTRQKPKNDNIMKSVLNFITGNREPNRSVKAGAVLEHFRREGLHWKEVAQHLKDGGGYQKLYRKVCAKAGDEPGADDGHADDLAMLEPAPSGSPDSLAAPHEASTLPLGDNPPMGAAIRSSVHDSDDIELADIAPRQPLSIANATIALSENAADDENCWGHSSISLKFNRKIHLLVEMDPDEIESVLNLEKALIRVVVGPSDAKGRSQVSGRLCWRSRDVSDPWPEIASGDIPNNDNGGVGGNGTGG